MRQLVIVEDFSSPPAQLLARLERASLPATPVVVYDANGAAGETTSAPALEPVETLADLPAQVFALPDRDGLVIVSAHHGGRFPERLGQRARSLLAACDTVVARCPRRDVVYASQFYSPFLYAADGQLDPAAVRTAAAHLLGRVDRARNEAARRRHDVIDEIPHQAPHVPTGEATRVANTDDEEPAVEATVFETAYGELSTEMARLGFELSERKVREGRAAVSVLVGGPGIALYGPYVALEEGDYRYRVEIEGGGRDVAFALEAAWNAGGQVLAIHRYALPQAGRVFADLVFQVTGPAVGRALELRVWNDDASAQFDVVRLSLVRLARSW